MINNLSQSAISLLKKLIETQSFSSEEHLTAQLVEKWFKNYNIPFSRNQNNVWATNKYFDASKKSILLNSHHDTVKPNKAYTKNPFKAIEDNGKLFGLGSNDAGGCLVSLLATFTYFYDKPHLNYNLVYVASAEEESSGPNGLNSMLKIIPEIDFAIVGEPTLMQMAIAEKGLLVLDCEAQGKPGHAAHNLGDNCIYKAMEDINWISNYSFPKISNTLGKVKMTVTQINAGKQHNVIPAKCNFVVDIRVNDAYTNKEVLAIVKNNLTSEVTARSLHLNSSSIDIKHPVVKAGLKWGRTTYGSPTLSDQSVLPCSSLKLGPGDSLRSHTADEFIFINEIEEGIDLYIKILNEIL
ncbi:MAG: M20 family metallo-hydrolase [Lutibacter sp.]